VDFPAKSVEQAPLWSKTSLLCAGALASAPETDRYCVVVSGAWWVASGDKSNADGHSVGTAGTFVRRVARTPHHDGVKANGTEPAVIAICGMGPITFIRPSRGRLAENVSPRDRYRFPAGSPSFAAR